MMQKREKKNIGPSKPSKITKEQQEWHTATSDDEEAYVSEMEQLIKD